MVSLSPDELRLENAMEATKSLFLRDLPAYVCVGPMPPGALNALELPLKDLDLSSPSIKHFVDLITDVPKTAIDLTSLQAVFRDQAWQELPEILTLKGRPTSETITQYFLLPQADDDFLVVLKHIYIPNDKDPAVHIKDFLRGSGYEIAWGDNNKKVVRQAFQWMLQQLGGTQLRKYTLTPEKKKPNSSAAQPEDEGWEFIKQHGELDKSDLKKQLKWIHHHINLEGCPIRGWQERLVQKALDSLANDTTTANWLLGQAGMGIPGKTPLGRIVAMMFSRFHGGTGTFRTTADLDFFKAVPFSKCCPALYDDGSIGGEEVKKLKVVTDVGDDESMTRARWTSAKFVRHQLRIILDNAFNPDAEPEDNNTEDALTVSHDDFFLMIRPALGNMSRTDAMAILKRSAFVVFGKQHITYRLPSEHAIKAHRIRWTKADILLDSFKPKLQNYKEGGPAPADADEHMWPGSQFLAYQSPGCYSLFSFFNHHNILRQCNVPHEHNHAKHAAYLQFVARTRICAQNDLATLKRYLVLRLGWRRLCVEVPSSMQKESVNRNARYGKPKCTASHLSRWRIRSPLVCICFVILVLVPTSFLSYTTHLKMSQVLRFIHVVCLGTKMATPGSLAKRGRILWMSTPIAAPWDG